MIQLLFPNGTIGRCIQLWRRRLSSFRPYLILVSPIIVHQRENSVSRLLGHLRLLTEKQAAMFHLPEKTLLVEGFNMTDLSIKSKYSEMAAWKVLAKWPLHDMFDLSKFRLFTARLERPDVSPAPALMNSGISRRQPITHLCQLSKIVPMDRSHRLLCQAISFSLTVLFAALPLMSAVADERRGDIELCRPGRATHASYGRDIVIPAGTQFVDTGPIYSRYGVKDRSLPVSLETISLATLKQNRRCIKVAAKAEVVRTSHVVAPGNHRLYEFSRSVPGEDSEYPRDLLVRPLTRFR